MHTTNGFRYTKVYPPYCRNGRSVPKPGLRCRVFDTKTIRKYQFGMQLYFLVLSLLSLGHCIKLDRFRPQKFRIFLDRI